jgi:hypothetical protein
VDVRNIREVADGVTIAEQGKKGLALADVAIDEPGAGVVAGTTIKIQDPMPPVEKATDDESSNPPAAAGHRDAKRLSHESDER